jgi:hypothetical protein
MLVFMLYETDSRKVTAANHFSPIPLQQFFCFLLESLRNFSVSRGVLSSY